MEKSAVWGIGLGVSWLVLAAPAAARPEYPGPLQEALGMECAPPCVVCHLQPQGGKNWTKFGLRVFPHTVAGEPWAEIVQSLRATDQDSDADGELDVAELERGTNPSAPEPSPLYCVRYGCGARLAEGGSGQWRGHGGALLMAAAIFVLSRGRRLRRLLRWLAP